MRRAVLVSFDGVAGERLARLLEEPDKLPAGGFRDLAARGFHAVRSLPPTPSLTAVAHITHVTGALPRDSGIVSNTMLDPSKSFPATISGFAARIRAETLWQAARRQGRRVGVMRYPGADGNGPGRTADWMMTWPGEPLAQGRLHELGADAWSTGEAAIEGRGSGGPQGPPTGSFSPPRRAVLRFEETSYSLELVALDTTDDRRANYDRMRVAAEPSGTRRDAAAGEWFPIEVAAKEGRTGAWCRVLSLSPDLSRTEIYVGDLSRNTGHPAAWVRTLDERVGFWPGTPDSELGAGSAHPELFLEQAERLAEFLTKTDLLAISRPDWDLLLVYHPEVDEAGHEFLLTDPAQPGYSPERSRRFLGLVERSYAAADRALAQIARALSPSDTLFVTSDHGMTPIRATIALDRILEEAGLLERDAKGRTNPSSALAAVTSSGIAHVHARAPATADAIDRAERVLSEFRDSGESPFDRIVRRAEAADLGLDAPESGDLIVLLKPGFQFVSGASRSRGPVGTPRSLGGHGYRNGFPEVDATFFAAGPGIPRARVETIGSWEVATRVARALGMEPPDKAARLPRRDAAR